MTRKLFAFVTLVTVVVLTESVGIGIGYSQDITVNRWPHGLLFDKTVSVSWLPNSATCVLKCSEYSTTGLPDDYPISLGTGLGTVAFRPVDKNLLPKQYSCLLVQKDDPSKYSLEFSLIVTTDQTGTGILPAGKINLNGNFLQFNWNEADGGVPGYFFPVSQTPFSIDSEAGTVTNLTLISGGVTRGTVMGFPGEDPLGVFQNNDIPPIISGNKYRTLALTAIGLTGAFVDVEHTGFLVETIPTRPTLGSSPTLLTPKVNERIFSDSYIYSWNAVPDAERYRLFIFGEVEFNNSRIGFVLWSLETNETELEIPLEYFLFNGDFKCQVYAESGNKVSASDLQAFDVSGVPTCLVRIEYARTDGSGARTGIKIYNKLGWQVPFSLNLDELGNLNIPLQAGEYTVWTQYPNTKDILIDVDLANISNINIIIDQHELSSERIFGRLTNSAGEGVPGVVSFPLGPFTKRIPTDADGYFGDAMPPGTREVRAEAGGYADAVQVVTLNGGEVKEVNVALLDAAGIIEGVVLLDGDPVPGYRVILTEERGYLKKMRTDGEGKYKFPVGTGIFQIRLDPNGYRSEQTIVTASAGQSAIFEMFSNGGMVTGRIVDAGGAGVPDAKVALSENLEVRTDAWGYFSIGLTAGQATVSISANGYAPLSREVSVTEGQSENLVIELEAFARVEGRIFAATDSTPVGNATLSSDIYTARSDADGNATLFVLPGRHTVKASAPGYGFVTAILVLEPGMSVQHDFYLPEQSGLPARIFARKYGSFTEGIPDVRVLILQAGADATASTNAGGHAVVLVPNVGRWEVTAFKKGYWPHPAKFSITVGDRGGDADQAFTVLPNTIYGKIFDPDSILVTSPVVVSVSFKLRGLIETDTYTSSQGEYKVWINPGDKTKLVFTSEYALYETDWFDTASMKKGDGLEINIQLSARPVSSVDESPSVPEEFILHQNYPNPFNPSTTIKYAVPKASHIQLIIYNIRGVEVRTLVDDFNNPGFREVIWNGVDDAGHKVSSGVYFYRFKAGEFSQIGKMLLLK
jgi:hypothetical protein